MQETRSSPDLDLAALPIHAKSRPRSDTAFVFFSTRRCRSRVHTIYPRRLQNLATIDTTFWGGAFPQLVKTIQRFARDLYGAQAQASAILRATTGRRNDFEFHYFGPRPNTA